MLTWGLACTWGKTGVKRCQSLKELCRRGNLSQKQHRCKGTHSVIRSPEGQPLARPVHGDRECGGSVKKSTATMLVGQG